jgi:hypothetical protein
MCLATRHWPDLVILQLLFQKVKQLLLEELSVILENTALHVIHSLLTFKPDGGDKFRVNKFSLNIDLNLLILLNKATGTSPSPRAAHAAVAVEKDQIVIYGGATGGGSLASDDLYLLDLRST